MSNRLQRSGDNRHQIAIGAGLLALLLVCGIAGFRIFSGKDKGPDSSNNPATGISYDQNAEENRPFKLSKAIITL